MVNASRFSWFLLNFLKFLLLFSLAYILFRYHENRPRVLIVHSYSPSVGSVKEFEKGVRKITDTRFYLSLNTHYMDTLSSATIHFRIAAGEQVKKAIKRIEPHVVVFVGDEAQEFAGKSYLKQDKIRIIFAGIKNKFDVYGYKPGENISGVIEKNMTHTLYQTLKDIRVGKNMKVIKRITFLCDASPESKISQSKLIDFDWKDIALVDTVIVNNFQDWKKAVKSLEIESDCLLVSDCRSLKETVDSNIEEFIDSEKVMQWTAKNTKNPILVLDGVLVQEGADIGVSPSAYMAGVEAAKMAFSYLEKSNKNQGSSPHQIGTSELFSIFLNSERLKVTETTVPSIYTSLSSEADNYF